MRLARSDMVVVYGQDRFWRPCSMASLADCRDAHLTRLLFFNNHDGLRLVLKSSLESAFLVYQCKRIFTQSSLDMASLRPLDPASPETHQGTFNAQSCLNLLAISLFDASPNSDAMYLQGTHCRISSTCASAYIGKSWQRQKRRQSAKAFCQ